MFDTVEMFPFSLQILGPKVAQVTVEGQWMMIHPLTCQDLSCLNSKNSSSHIPIIFSGADVVE